MIKHLSQSSMMDDSAETGVEVIQPSGLDQLQRAEIDIQVSTAKRYPRNIDLFKRRAIALATLDDDTAESCIYRRPVGKDQKTGKEVYAEGMSVRMAEIVGASYGNLRVAATIIEQTERKVVARGMAFDLETNFASSSEVVESTVTKNGGTFSERMRIVVAKSALAKARRDATFQVVPRAIAKPVEEAVRQLLLGNTQSLEKRRQRSLAWISKLDVGVERVFAALGIKGPSDLTAEELEKLTGLKTAIKDGEISIDEAFPELAPKMRQAAGVALDAPGTGNAAPIMEGEPGASLGAGDTNALKSATAPTRASGVSATTSPASNPSNAGQEPVSADAPALAPKRRAKSGLSFVQPQLEARDTPQQSIEIGCVSHGISFDKFRQWANTEQDIADADSWGSWSEIPTAKATLWLRAGEALYAEVAQ